MGYDLTGSSCHPTPQITDPAPMTPGMEPSRNRGVR